jgi:CheY-like chemotaxis protein
MEDRKQVDILLVEDNPDDAELTIRALRKNNLANRLVHVGDGAEALDFMFCRGRFEGKELEDRPRLILLDLKLPKIDGLEVLRALKTDARTRATPVVVLTTSKEESDLARSYEYGANSYIVKPVDFGKFVEAMREVGSFWLLLNKVP